MSAPSSSPLLEEIKALWQFAKKPSIWIPSVTIPLFAIALWAYSSNPQWLEATKSLSARTGKAVTTDPNSPVTTADLDLDPDLANAETPSFAALLAQAAQDTPNSEGKDKENQAPDFVNQLLQPPSSENKGEVSNPFAKAIQEFLNRNINISNPENTAQFSPLLGSVAVDNSNNNDPLQQALSNLQAQNNNSAIANANSANSNPSLASQNPSSVNLPTPTLAGTYAYPSQPGVTGYTAPIPGVSANVGSRGSGGYVVSPQGTYEPLHERGTTGYTVTPQGSYVPLPQRGGTSTTVTPQGTYSYPRDRGTTGYTPPQTTNPNNLNNTLNNQPFTPNTNPYSNPFNPNTNTNSQF
ncbi:MAG: hypothetical protein SAJ12_22575 [Jaaginema sp. PMC 1079.18]|nr:hypothetical protein [Jaaginema sp. PMC 1080.18]MEC4853775.1 hypothetical protein [Jaaginema sp. PMC 1079.18]MEC4869091.1 hypothetical protein [Jaaginema sp. PMC 1078.18]